MRRRLICVALGSLSALVLASCQDVPTGSSGDPPLFEIKDAVHNEGNQHFYFLPPMVPAPSYTGVFDGGLTPTVEICEWTGSGCTPVLATYSMTTGPGSETVRVADEHYIVNWHTDAFTLDVTKTYRIRVLAEGTELGFADVDVVTLGKELRNVNTGEYIPLLDGRTLPIRFRIEEGWEAYGAVEVLETGGYHSCRLTEAGAAYCWGYGYNGQLGNGSNLDESAPVAVSGEHKFIALALGMTHTCGITTDHLAYCWGAGSRGQLGNGGTSSANVPVAVSGNHASVALTAGYNHTCAITQEGAAYCWGLNETGALGIGTITTPWEQPEPVLVVGEHAFTALSAGNAHTCGITPDGSAYCWGYGLYGQLGDGTNTQKQPIPVPVSGSLTFVGLTAGYNYTCAIAQEGAAYCWGSGDFGKLGNGSTGNVNAPVPVLGDHIFSVVDAGDQHTCGLTAEGSALCWGYGSFGQLGNGGTSNESAPVAVSGDYSFAGISAACLHTCGLTQGGEAYCWGFGHYGQIGSGEALDENLLPVAVLVPSGGW